MFFCDSGVFDLDKRVTDLRLMSPCDIQSVDVAVLHLRVTFPYAISVCSSAFLCVVMSCPIIECVVKNGISSCV